MTLRNVRHTFHEKSTLIFAILRYLQSLKEQLKLLNFAAKYTWVAGDSFVPGWDFLFFVFCF